MCHGFFIEGVMSITIEIDGDVSINDMSGVSRKEISINGKVIGFNSNLTDEIGDELLSDMSVEQLLNQVSWSDLITHCLEEKKEFQKNLSEVLGDLDTVSDFVLTLAEEAVKTV